MLIWNTRVMLLKVDFWQSSVKMANLYSLNQYISTSRAKQGHNIEQNVVILQGSIQKNIQLPQ